MATGRGLVARALFVAAFGLMVSVHAYAHDDPFKTVIKHIEKDYNAKKSGVPMLGLANFVLKFWHPAGVKNIKVALFDNQDLTPRAGSPDFDSVVTGATAGGWQPIARVYSRQKGQWTYIYYTDPGKDMKILVVSLEHQNAVVAQVRFNNEKLVSFVQNPRLLGIKLADDIRRGPTQNNAAGAGQSGIAATIIGDDDSDDDSNGVPVRSFNTRADIPRSKSGPPSLLGPGEAEYRPVSFLSSAPPDPNPLPDRVPGERVIKLETRLVNLNVQATDNSGRPVTGLTKGDFNVFENGARQNITYFSPDTSPVSVLLLLDLSGSTKNKAKTMKAAAERFVEKLTTGDRVAVATFTRRFRVVSDFSSDLGLVEQRIKKIKNREGGTAYYDAMWMAFDMIGRLDGARKAIIVLTDGVDNSLQNPNEYPTRRLFSEVADRASEDEVTVYPIYMDTEHDKRAWVGRRTGLIYEQARGELQRLADDTAGTMYRVSSKDDLKNVYEQVAAELHTIYTMAYTPERISNNGDFRTIRVTVNEPGVVTRTRKGYYAR